MNVRIVKSQEEMGKIHSYHDTWLPALNIFFKFVIVRRSGAIDRHLKCTGIVKSNRKNRTFRVINV